MQLVLLRISAPVVTVTRVLIVRVVRGCGCGNCSCSHSWVGITGWMVVAVVTSLLTKQGMHAVWLCSSRQERGWQLCSRVTKSKVPVVAELLRNLVGWYETMVELMKVLRGWFGRLQLWKGYLNSKKLSWLIWSRIEGVV